MSVICCVHAYNKMSSAGILAVGPFNNSIASMKVFASAFIQTPKSYNWHLGVCSLFCKCALLTACFCFAGTTSVCHSDISQVEGSCHQEATGKAASSSDHTPVILARQGDQAPPVSTA